MTRVHRTDLKSDQTHHGSRLQDPKGPLGVSVDNISLFAGGSTGRDLGITRAESGLHHQRHHIQVEGTYSDLGVGERVGPVLAGVHL